MINEFKISIDKLYKTISIKKDLLNYSNEIYDDFFDYILVLIRNRLINILNSNYDGQITIDDLNNILMELLYKNLIFDEENEEYIKIIFLIKELSNNKYLPVFSSLSWKKIVILSKNYFYLSNDIIINRINTITNKRGKELKSITIDVEPLEDVIVNGLCFIKIKKKAKIKIYALDNVGVYKRKSLI